MEDMKKTITALFILLSYSAMAYSQSLVPPVRSVKGNAGAVKKGDVVLSPSDFDLDATRDILKPISNATQSALDTKTTNSAAAITGGSITGDVYISTDNTITAPRFSGDGSGLTGLPGIVTATETCDAMGNGLVDDAPALNACAAAHKVIDFGGPDKTYKLSSALTLTTGNRIICNGAVLNMDTTMTGTNAYTAITAIGSLGTTSQALTVSCGEGSYACSVADASVFSEGQYVQLYSGGAYTYKADESYLVDRGEIKKIRLASGTTVTFTTPLLDTYATTTVAAIQSVNWVEGIGISGCTINGNGNLITNQERGIALRYVNGFEISGGKLNDQATYQVEVNSSINGSVHHNQLHGVFYNGTTGTIFYGVTLINSTQWVNVHDNSGDRNRHLVITSAATRGQGYYGMPSFINIHHNSMTDSMSGGGGESYCYEVHGFGRYISLDTNQCDGGYAGVRIEGGWVISVSNNIIKNYGVQGIIIGGASNNGWLDRVSVTNNIIDTYTGRLGASNNACIHITANNYLADFTASGNKCFNASFGSYGSAFYIGASANGMYRVKFKDNTSRATSVTTTPSSIISAPSTTGVQFDGNSFWGWGNTATLYGFNFKFSDNTFDSGVPGYAGTYLLSSQTTASGFVVSGNKFLNNGNGVALRGQNNIVTDNLFSNQTYTTLGYGLYVSGSHNTISGNVFDNIYTAIRTDTTSTNNSINALPTRGANSINVSNGGGSGNFIVYPGADMISIGTGTAYKSWALPNCPDTGGKHLNYTPSAGPTCGTS